VGFVSGLAGSVQKGDVVSGFEPVARSVERKPRPFSKSERIPVHSKTKVSGFEPFGREFQADFEKRLVRDRGVRECGQRRIRVW
jgi:hypothetical protein